MDGQQSSLREWGFNNFVGSTGNPTEVALLGLANNLGHNECRNITHLAAIHLLKHDPLNNWTSNMISHTRFILTSSWEWLLLVWLELKGTSCQVGLAIALTDV